MLSDEEKHKIVSGRMAEKLVKLPEWELFDRDVREMIRLWENSALQRGETNFEKGAVFGMKLLINAPSEMIAEMKELVKREAATEDSESEILGDESVEGNSP